MTVLVLEKYPGTWTWTLVQSPILGSNPGSVICQYRLIYVLLCYLNLEAIKCFYDQKAWVGRGADAIFFHSHTPFWQRCKNLPTHVITS